MSNHYYLWSDEFWKLLFVSVAKKKKISDVTKYIFIIVDRLPCSKCKEHFYKLWSENNLFSSNDINKIYAFLIRIYNLYSKKKININKVKLLKWDE